MPDTPPCPRCGSDAVIPDVRLTDRTEDGTYRTAMLGLFRKPSALLFKSEMHVEMTARVCSDCGHVDFYAADPPALWTAHLNATRNERPRPGEGRAVVLVPGFIDRAQRCADRALSVPARVRAARRRAAAEQRTRRAGRAGRATRRLCRRTARRPAVRPRGLFDGRPRRRATTCSGSAAPARVGPLVTLASPHRGTVASRAWPGIGGARRWARQRPSTRPQRRRRDAGAARLHVALDAVRPHDRAADVVTARSGARGPADGGRAPADDDGRRALAAVADALEGPE